MRASAWTCRAAIVALIVIAAAYPGEALAYIGPGAGFAFLGSSFVFVLSFFLMIATVLFWPVQWLLRAWKRRAIAGKARAKRVVIVGLDGLEPTLVERLMGEGVLPHLSALAAQGSYSRLATTLPALSPVAWSTFQTGVNPGAHNIFDFLTRDKRHCLPLLSSTATEVREGGIRIGRWRLFAPRARVRILRGSRPFWKILGEYGIFSNIIRVPISYPPEPCFGNVLSAMCTPDLRGSQGMFSFFSSRTKGRGTTSEGTTGGERAELTKSDGVYRGVIAGPEGNKGILTVEFTLTPLDRERAELALGALRQVLILNQFSPWIELQFRDGRREISGIARFCLRRLSDDVELYVTPVNINPEKPVLPIGAPVSFPIWLAKRHGAFGTLGLMEDTWGRNEQAIDDQRFLDQTYLAHEEREKMFFDMLARTREGVCACVFDASDRIQHMFWRYLDDSHPSPRESEHFASTIREMYLKMDDLVGRVRQQLNDNDLLLVMSDHGFSSFRRCVNLNDWLFDNGYLALKQGAAREGDYFKNVDWSKTKAFAVGLTGIYLNRRGRELQGIVEDRGVAALKAELIGKLEALRDPQDGAVAIRTVYDSEKEYRGMYTREAPDLICGYAPGYRVSWGAVTGGFENSVFSDNLKAWSGDHHVDPVLVPGVLFSSRALKAESPGISEIAPTVLGVFGVPKPAYMTGRVLL